MVLTTSSLILPMKRCVGRRKTALCDIAAASGQETIFSVHTFRFNKHDTPGTHRPVLGVNVCFFLFSSGLVLIPVTCVCFTLLNTTTRDGWETERKAAPGRGPGHGSSPKSNKISNPSLSCGVVVPHSHSGLPLRLPFRPGCCHATVKILPREASASLSHPAPKYA